MAEAHSPGSGYERPESGSTLHSRNTTSTEEESSERDKDVVTPLVSDLANQTGGIGEDLDLRRTATSSTFDGTTNIEGGSAIKSPLSTTTSNPVPLSTFVSHEHVANGYFSNPTIRQTNSKRSLRTSGATGQSSSGSLQTLAEQEGVNSASSVRRAVSQRAPHSPVHGRRHSKSASMSQHVASFKQALFTNNDQPQPFPDQSYLRASDQHHSSRPPQLLRTRSSHPAQNMLYKDAAILPKSSHDRFAPHTMAKTADNTPISSPGLFSPTASRSAALLGESDRPRSDSPQLHHLQVPKETHAAEIDHDSMTGNKIINTYEVVRELGRGEHGKVKLGRDMVNEYWVAIKIVPRYSRNRKLGHLGQPPDQTKREVAILKRARHPNVVSLLEVIDDPNKNKVYIVLEYVDNGEIKWRRPGVSAIARINNLRFESERKGISLTTEPSDQDIWQVNQELRRRNMTRPRTEHLHTTPGVSHWHAECDIEEEGSDFDGYADSNRPRSVTSPPSRTQSHDEFGSVGSYMQLSGSMFGPYDDRIYRPERKQSIAPSHMSSEVDVDLVEDEQFSFVPALTQDEARRTFRDTLLGLEFLHAIGIIHRDIKPSNLLVGSDGTVKISDFGVSYLGRPMTEADAEASTVKADVVAVDDERELARSVGTPAFWAPELCYEEPDIFEDNATPKITGALDLWALGITLYCMIYARLPFYATDHIGLHEAVCTTEVCVPKTRLVPADTSQERFLTAADNVTINSNKRLDYELRFEHVPERLRDLIQKLLTKDPAKRITIAQAKNHPWVTEKLDNVDQFLKPPEIEKRTKKVLDVPEKDISVAVIKRSFMARTWEAGRNMMQNLLPGATKGRQRASSTATAASNSSESVNNSPGSTTSTAKQVRESRRASLRGDELLNALQKSRENTEHPLAQSQTASPDNQEVTHYFSGATPQLRPSPHESPRISPLPDDERRPRLQDRAISALSTADSVRTIRASQQPNHLFDLGRVRDHSRASEASLKARVEGLWEGTHRTLQRLGSRERYQQNTSRSPSSSRRSSEHEVRSLPSVAISNTQARGAVEMSSDLLSPGESAPSESSASSQSHPSPIVPEVSTAGAWDSAETQNQRRHIQELHGTEAIPIPEAMPTPTDSCPQSPDDVQFLEQHKQSPPEPSPLVGNIPTTTSASTMSSMDPYSASSVTQSLSNPSIVLTSGTSSPPGEQWVSEEYRHLKQLAEAEPEDMKTTDTVIEHGRSKPSTAMGKPLEREHEYYDDGDDEQDSEDEDDGIMMGGPKKAPV